MIKKIKIWARNLILELKAIYIAAKSASTPRTAKLMAIAVTAYAMSPIDLIPDFIPVLGYLDDLIIVPAGIAIIVRLIPDELMNSYRTQAKALDNLNANWIVGAMVVLAWIVLSVFAFKLLF